MSFQAQVTIIIGALDSSSAQFKTFFSRFFPTPKIIEEKMGPFEKFLNICTVTVSCTPFLAYIAISSSGLGQNKAN